MKAVYREFPDRILGIQFAKNDDSMIPESNSVIASAIAGIESFSNFQLANSTISISKKGYKIKSGKNDVLNFSVAEEENGFTIGMNLDEGDAVFGLGEHLGPLNKKGKVYEMYNIDDPEHSPEKTRLYSAFPVFQIVSPKKSLGFFIDHPGYSKFDVAFSSESELRITIEGSGFNLYGFGNSPG